MSRRLKGAAALVFTFVTVSGLVISAAKPPADVPVIAIVADTQASTPLRVGNDGFETYVTGSPAGLSSVIRPTATGSSWLFFTYTYGRGGKISPTGRGIRFDLSEQNTLGGFPTPIAANTVWPAYVYVNCSAANVDMLTMTAGGDPVVCPGSIRFWHKTATINRWYRLAFSPENYPADSLDPIRVTCTESANPGCKTWTITPSGAPQGLDDPNPKNHTKLLEIDEGGFVLSEGGTYYVSFAMTITR